MLHPKNIAISDYTYNLPEVNIAQYPLSERDQSKLLVYKSGKMETSCYAKLPQHLPKNTTLIFNNTKVVEARLLFTKLTGGVIELFCLEPHDSYPDITNAMLEKKEVLWKCLVGGAKKWKQEPLYKIIETGNQTITLKATKKAQLADCFLIELEWDDDTLSFAEILHYAGLIPLPPYLHRAAEATDKNTYQTIYAKHDGSVAAPTAGLHFTMSLFENLAIQNILPSYVTLHVGAGTFKPVKAATMEHHEMHSEFINVPIDVIKNLQQQVGNCVVAVGTTSLRTIETLYWMGVKLGCALKNTDWNPITLEAIVVYQWDAYHLPQDVPVTEALRVLLEWMERNSCTRIIAKTQIIIAPPYKLRVAKGLITNFHQPQSTLLLLVAAIVGNNWRNIYQYALKNKYRFLSYGDGSLLWTTDML